MARTMWLCWMVKRGSPVWVSQIFLQAVGDGSGSTWVRSTYAVKSADAVAALLAFGLSRACHTAPLWPMKVPILMAVSIRDESGATPERLLAIPVACLAVAQHRVAVCRKLA